MKLSHIIMGAILCLVLVVLTKYEPFSNASNIKHVRKGDSAGPVSLADAAIIAENLSAQKNKVTPIANMSNESSENIKVRPRPSNTFPKTSFNNAIETDSNSEIPPPKTGVVTLTFQGASVAMESFRILEGSFHNFSSQQSLPGSKLYRYDILDAFGNVIHSDKFYKQSNVLSCQGCSSDAPKNEFQDVDALNTVHPLRFPFQKSCRVLQIFQVFEAHATGHPTALDESIDLINNPQNKLIGQFRLLGGRE